MPDELKCMYCLECTPTIPTSFSSSSITSLGCACKGSLGNIHLYCKAKFARFKTFSVSSTPRTREYYWNNCEICSTPFKNLDAVVDLARERHLQCLYHRYDAEEGVSNEAFWKELCMSACFFATVVVKKCKDVTALDDESEVPFWMESCNTLSSTIQLLQQLAESPHQLALLWSAEMKFVDCLYYVMQMKTGHSSSLEDIASAYDHACELVKRYNIRFGTLATSMFAIKKFAEDLKQTGRKRNADGSFDMTVEEKKQFKQLQLKVIEEMGLANALGGAKRHCFSEQLSCQVEFVNYETYGKHAESNSVKL